MAKEQNQIRENASLYDEGAEATGWFGPEVAFGLIYKFINPGQSILDIGIGTGLASELFRQAELITHGMDISPEMLDVCRSKGFDKLTGHSLLDIPFPYDSGSFDHIVCVGVMHFFLDLSKVFAESFRLLKSGGLFVFVTGDREKNEPMEVTVSEEHTETGQPVVFYLHTQSEIQSWLDQYGFECLRELAFSINMDIEKKQRFKARAYLVRKS